MRKRKPASDHVNDNRPGFDPSHRPIGWFWMMLVLVVMAVAVIWSLT